MRLKAANLIAMLALMLLSASAMAAQPPGPGRPGGGGDPGSHKGGPPTDHRPSIWRGGMEWNEADWKKSQDFFQKNSPKRWDMLQKLAKDSPERRGFERLLYYRWKQIDMFHSDAPVYDNLVLQVQAEDVVAGLVSDLGAKPANSTQLDEDLKKQVTALVKLRLDERKLRIERIRQLLNREQESYQADDAKQDELVDEAVKRAKEGKMDWLHRDPWRRPGSDRPGGKGPETGKVGPDGPKPSPDQPQPDIASPPPAAPGVEIK